MHVPFATRDPAPYATRDPNARVAHSSTGDGPVPPFVDTPLDGDLTGDVAR